MVFNSKDFFIFLVLIYLVFWLSNPKFRRVILLIGSYFFCAYLNPWLALLLLFVSFLAYKISLLIENSLINKKKLLCLGLIVLSLPLLYFKYFNFMCQSCNFVFGLEIPFWNILLPAGISFYTFQCAGYMIDVYRKEITAEKNFITLALFKSFFPQLVAGPIERAKNLLPQLENEERFQYNSENFFLGLKIILWGLFKKVVIADRLALFVNPIYDNYQSQSGTMLLIATILFAFQIYCDFSGYSDIAIGVARLFGVNLMQNFNKPYFANSIVDFWRRWHISLSTWFKDYIYMPLGGNKVNIPRWCINIMIVFVISGFWHGARWNFVVWGIIHGIALIVNRLTQNISNKFPAWLNYLLTFAFVNLTWVFFRSKTVLGAFEITNQILADGFVLDNFQNINYYLEVNQIQFNDFLFYITLPLLLLILESFKERDYMPLFFTSSNKIVANLSLYLLVLVVILCGYFGKSAFIYFQF